MSAEKLQKAGDDQFKEATKIIEKLETMIAENTRDIKEFTEANAALKKTIELLKERRRQIIGISKRVRPLTFADEHSVIRNREDSGEEKRHKT